MPVSAVGRMWVPRCVVGRPLYDTDPQFESSMTGKRGAPIQADAVERTSGLTLSSYQTPRPRQLGIQSFGGEGLSSADPKVGSPH